jgi:hypothetical protein
MTQTRCEFDLSLEAFCAKYDRDVCIEHLYGNLAVVRDVPCEVHGRHAALTDLAFYKVLVTHGGPKLLNQKGHWTEISSGNLPVCL